MTKEDIIQLIENDVWMMDILRLVRTLNLPDWYIGAGFIRSKVWDELHNYSERTPLPDIDIIYLNKTDFTAYETDKDTTAAEIGYERRLEELMANIEWSVTNQARMHLFHNDDPYISSEEALSNWVETATCIGVRLDEKGQLVLVAPRGIADLIQGIIRPTSSSPENLKIFNERVLSKNWLQKWPLLKKA